MNVDDSQINPDHYKFGKIEVVELTEQLSFNRGNAVKYICRAGRKSPETELIDLAKAQWYIQRETKRLTS